MLARAMPSDSAVAISRSLQVIEVFDIYCIGPGLLFKV